MVADSKRKNRPGQGRKKSESTAFKEATQKFIDAAPDIADATLLRAIGGPVKIKCIHCGKEDEYRIPGVTGDTKLLEYINDRIHGKPTQKSEIDLRGKIELPNQKLAQYHIMIMNVEQAIVGLDLTGLKKSILLPPVDDTGHAEANVPG